MDQALLGTLEVTVGLAPGLIKAKVKDNGFLQIKEEQKSCTDNIRSSRSRK